MKTNDIINESLEDQLAQAKKGLLQAKRYADSPGGNWQARDKVRFAYDQIASIQQEIDKSDGTLKSVQFEIAEEDSTELHSKLHELWQGTGVHDLPWKMLHSEHPGMVTVAFYNYKPEDKAGKFSVKMLVKYVERLT